MKKLWENTTTTAKKRLDDLRVRGLDFSKRHFFLQNNAGNWNTFAEKCQTLQTQVTTAQKQIDDVKKVGNMFSSPPLKFPHSAVRDQPSKGRP